MKLFILGLLILAALTLGLVNKSLGERREYLSKVATDLDKTLPIKTDSVKTHPAGTTQNRAWFVEMVQ